MVTTGNGQNARGLDEGTVGIDAFLNSTFHLKKATSDFCIDAT